MKLKKKLNSQSKSDKEQKKLDKKTLNFFLKRKKKHEK